MGKQQQPSEPEKFERWTAQRKAAIILEVLKGKVSVPEAARKYGFTQGEHRNWADKFARGGIDALRSIAKVSMSNVVPKFDGYGPR